MVSLEISNEKCDKMLLVEPLLFLSRFFMAFDLYDAIFKLLSLNNRYFWKIIEKQLKMLRGLAIFNLFALFKKFALIIYYIGQRF